MNPQEYHPSLPGSVPAILEWVDSAKIKLDHTIALGLGYDFFGLECLRQEAFTPETNFALWPNNGKWSLYSTCDGGLWMERFATEAEAKAIAEKVITDLRAPITPAPVDPAPAPLPEDVELVDAYVIAALVSFEKQSEKAFKQEKEKKAALLSRFASLRLEITRVTGERDTAKDAHDFFLKENAILSKNLFETREENSRLAASVESFMYAEAKAREERDAARKALEEAPIGLLGETFEDFLRRYKEWYRETRRTAIAQPEAQNG